MQVTITSPSSTKYVMDYYTAVRAFIRVVEAGSFTKASAGLELPRNTVTKLVQALEGHLRVKLLNRTTRRVSLTNDGTAYYERMSRIMNEWQEAESDLAMSQGRPRGKIRVDMATLLATQLVIPALPRFYEKYPDIQLDLGVSDKPSDLVGDRIDCVLRAGRVTDPSLIARHIGDLRFVLCATRGYLARHGNPSHPAEIESGHELVQYFFAGSGKRFDTILKRGAEQWTLQGRYLVSCNDANAQLASGLAGLGILDTLSVVAQPYIDDGRLVRILDEWSAESVPVSVVYAPNRHLSARVRVFVEWMKEVFDGHPQTRLGESLLPEPPAAVRTGNARSHTAMTGKNR